MYSVSSRADIVMEEHAKELLYKIHCGRGEFAIDANGNKHPLQNFNVNQVRHIGGMWRVQNKFEHKIQMVRGREFVLVEKIDRTEKNKFEFYRARMVGCNCYGRYLVGGPECIVAKYETDAQNFWAYGKTIEEARAFLGIRLYDEFSDLIHSVACKNKSRGK